MRTLAIFCASLATLVAATRPAEAIPRFSIRKAASCAMCHVDPSGGGMRNDYGRSVYVPTELALEALSLPEGAPPLEAKVSDSIAFGSNVRLLYQHLNSSTGAVPSMDSFYVMQAALYCAADLWKYVTLYVAPAFYGSETVFFEAAGILHIPFLESYLKLGRFTVPYGYKLPNHSVFIRKQLGFNVRTKDVGLELGLNPGPFLLQLAMVNGTSDRSASDWDDNSAKAISARVSGFLNTRPIKLQLGLSAYYNIAGSPPEEDPGQLDTRVEDLKIGAFGGASIGRFAYLGEIDYWRRDDRGTPAPLGQLFSFQELSFLPLRGVELVLTYELWDQDVQIAGNAAHRFGGGVELFLLPFTELDVAYRYVHADPRHSLAKLHEFFLVGHVYF